MAGAVAWYFLMFSAATVVGPFPDKATCEAVRQQTQRDLWRNVSECWSFQYQEVKP